VATGASGFGIMAVVVGVERGFITREQGLERLTKIATFLKRAPRYHGVWSHFMDGPAEKACRCSICSITRRSSGNRFPDGRFVGGSPVFPRPSAHEKELYENISYLWNTVEWIGTALSVLLFDQSFRYSTAAFDSPAHPVCN